MSDTVFRSKIDTPAPAQTPQGTEPTQSGESNVEVPYLDYQMEQGKPYLVEYFQLGDTWNDLQGGFPQEINLIGDYIESKVKTGEIANSQQAVKDLLSGIEKLTNTKKESRAVIKIETIAAYIRFLNSVDKTRSNLRRYNAY